MLIRAFDVFTEIFSSHTVLFDRPGYVSFTIVAVVIVTDLAMFLLPLSLSHFPFIYFS